MGKKNLIVHQEVQIKPKRYCFLAYETDQVIIFSVIARKLTIPIIFNGAVYDYNFPEAVWQYKCKNLSILNIL